MEQLWTPGGTCWKVAEDTYRICEEVKKQSKSNVKGIVIDEAYLISYRIQIPDSDH